MSAHQTRQTPVQPDGHGHGGHPRRQRGHRWLMIACCMPMLAIAVALVATGVVGVGFIFIALMCTAMMALMHRGMSHEDERPHDRH